MLFGQYAPAHRARLQERASSPEWQEALARPDELERLRGEMVYAPGAPSQLGGAGAFLKECNTGRARALIAGGARDENAIAGALGDWRAALESGAPFPILFLGLVLTIECSFKSRCLYCNQAPMQQRLGLADWKALVAEVSEPIAPYLYLTGGEPLLLGEQVWGDDGLVAFAARRGCAVNINTNAALITPRVALHLVRAGLSKLHISVDCADALVQGELFGDPARVEAVWRGILNVQVAREALGAQHPTIHINCVLTRRNLFRFPELLRALLDARPQGDSGDFAFHLIPVGGADNAPLRPTAEEWQRFYTETWDEAQAVWHDYQRQAGVPEEQLSSLSGHVPFANPWLRVEHRMTLEEYCRAASEGVYWQGALSERCYLGPSQAYVLPDGSQHWCGGHAIRRPEPLGDAREGIRANIRRSLERLAELPSPVCAGCAGATCVINRSLENGFREEAQRLLAEG